MLPTHRPRQQKRPWLGQLAAWFAGPQDKQLYAVLAAAALFLLLLLLLKSARSGRDRERQATEAEARAATELAAIVRDHDTRIAELAGAIGALDAAALRAASLQSSGKWWRQQWPLEEDRASLSSQPKLAVIAPYRDRASQLATFATHITHYLTAQGRSFALFVIEQAPGLRFNRGALLNVGFLLLAASDFDCLVFHDIDTLPTERGAIMYECPNGTAPFHLTPPGIHPRVKYEEFFGGVTIFSRDQFEAVNGYGTEFWGWGREDDNMRRRLQGAGMWPPQVPDVPKQASSRHYFSHATHKKAPEVRYKTGVGGGAEYFESKPDAPFKEAKIVSSQPGLLDETATGLNTTYYRITNLTAMEAGGIKYTVSLHCDHARTPWCS